MKNSSSLWYAKAAALAAMATTGAAGAAMLAGYNGMAAGLLALACLAGGAAFTAVARLARTLREIGEACEKLQRGRFDVRVHIPRGNDEVRNLAIRINGMVDHLDAFVREASASMTYVGRNLYFRRILPPGLHGDVARSAEIINHATEEVAAKIKKFTDVATTLEDTLQSVSTELMAAIRMLEETAHEMVESATATDKETQLILGTAEGAQRRVRDTLEASTTIGNVLDLIKEIASHTNLLALNASIESARAGDAGLGFAVVTGEIKQLANQTAESTEAIATQVNALQSAAKDISVIFLEEANQKSSAASASIISQLANIKRNMGSIQDASQQVMAATQELSIGSAHRLDTLRGSMQEFMAELRKIS